MKNKFFSYYIFLTDLHNISQKELCPWSRLTVVPGYKLHVISLKWDIDFFRKIQNFITKFIIEWYSQKTLNMFYVTSIFLLSTCVKLYASFLYIRASWFVFLGFPFQPKSYYSQFFHCNETTLWVLQYFVL